MITGIDINTDRINYIVHLENEADGLLFWVVPQTDDGSKEWVQVQAWLDAGNNATDTIGWRDLYSGNRRGAYPPIAEQLDKLYHDMANNKLNTTGEWHKSIKAIKDANPKPV